MSRILMRSKASVRDFVAHMKGPSFWARTWPSILVVSVVVALGLCGAVFLSPWAVLPSPERVVAPLVQVQGAIAAISLAVMVLIVEAVQRREDIVDVTYEVFLDKASVKPVIAVVLLSTLGTVTAFVLARMPSFEDERNLALFAAFSTAATVIAILFFTLRALTVLRPSRYREFKRQAYLEEVRHGMKSYRQQAVSISADTTQPTTHRLRDEASADDAISRLFTDITKAMVNAQAEDVRAGTGLLEEIISQILGPSIQSENKPIQPSNESYSLIPGIGAIQQHFPTLWQAAYSSETFEYVYLVSKVHSMLTQVAVNSKSIEIFDASMTCALSSYQQLQWKEGVAMGIKRAWETIKWEYWFHLFTREQGDVSPTDISEISPTDINQLRKIIEQFQICAGLMVQDGNIIAFKQITAEVSDLHNELAHNQYRYDEESDELDQTINELLQYLRLAFAALGGRAILLQEEDAIDNARVFIDRIWEVFQDVDSPDKCLALISDINKRPLTHQWLSWELKSDGSALPRAQAVFPEQYPFLYFLTVSLMGQSKKRPPQMIADRKFKMPDTLDSHWSVICDVAGVGVEDRESEKGRIREIVEAQKQAAKRQTEDRIIATSIDGTLVKQYVQEVQQRYEQVQLNSQGALANVFTSSNRVWVAESDGIDAPSVYPIRSQGAFKGAFMRLREIAYAPHPSASQIVNATDRVLHQWIMDAIHAEPSKVRAAEADENTLGAVLSSLLTELQPIYPLFLFTGRGTEGVWRQLHRAMLMAQLPGTPPSIHIPDNVIGALNSGRLVSSRTNGLPMLYVIDVGRWGLLRQAKIGENLLNVDIRAISEERAKEMIDIGMVPKGELSDDEAVWKLQLQVEVEVTQRVDFIVEDPSAVVEIVLQTPLSPAEAAAQDRIESDPFTTQEGERHA